jgi:hypothetical protein
VWNGRIGLALLFFAPMAAVAVCLVLLFDGRGRIAAPVDAPFDYHVDGRRVMMELELSL